MNEQNEAMVYSIEKNIFCFGYRGHQELSTKQ